MARKGAGPSALKPQHPVPPSVQDLSTFTPLLTWSPPGSLPEPHLCEHDQPNKKGDDRHAKDEALPPVLLAEHTGVHVHQCRHQALYAHKLDERAKELEGKRAPRRSSITSAGLWLAGSALSAALSPVPRAVLAWLGLDPPSQLLLVPGRAFPSDSCPTPSCFKVQRGIKLDLVPTAAPPPAHPHPLVSQPLSGHHLIPGYPVPGGRP